MKKPFLNARIFMGSMTNLANRPFRRWVTGFGAEATIGEMAIASYVVKGGSQDAALLRRDAHEKIFGAQIVGANPNHLAKAARLAERYGADFVDFNCACPHQSVISHGGGAMLLTRPDKIVTQLDAIRQAVSIPVTIKIRKGYEADDDVAQAVVDVAQRVGFDAVFIHGRTKAAQYRGPCDWECIESVARNSDIPVIGCGDLAHGNDVMCREETSACAGFALARGALAKPWVFREIAERQPLDPSSQQRLEWFKTLVTYTLDAFGRDRRGLDKSQKFLLNQLEFMCRYVPPAVLGRELPTQERVELWTPRDDLEALWAQSSRDAHKTLLGLAGFPEEPVADPRQDDEAGKP